MVVGCWWVVDRGWWWSGERSGRGDLWGALYWDRMVWRDGNKLLSRQLERVHMIDPWAEFFCTSEIVRVHSQKAEAAGTSTTCMYFRDGSEGVAISSAKLVFSTIGRFGGNGGHYIGRLRS